MILIFTSVGNDAVQRHSFDDYDTSKVEDCLAIYDYIHQNMPECDFHCYDLSGNPKSRIMGVYEFEQDYNDEELDGGFWVFALTALDGDTLFKHIMEKYY